MKNIRDANAAIGKLDKLIKHQKNLSKFGPVKFVGYLVGYALAGYLLKDTSFMQKYGILYILVVIAALGAWVSVYVNAKELFSPLEQYIIPNTPYAIYANQLLLTPRFTESNDLCTLASSYVIYLWVVDHLIFNEAGHDLKDVEVDLIYGLKYISDALNDSCCDYAQISEHTHQLLSEMGIEISEEAIKNDIKLRLAK